jgi:uncharacterized protein
MKIEYRTAELRAATAAFEVAGRAASYNKLSNDLGGFREQLLPGCFTRSLASGEQDVKCLVNHDSNQVLGRQANRTLTLTDTSEGLNFVCKLNKDSQAHRDLYASVKRGDLSECSFAFIADDDSFSAPDRNGLLTRTIKRAKLLDVSVVASPAYGNGATKVDARALAQKHSPSLKQTIAEARFRAGAYPELSLEDIAIRMRIGYSEDAMNLARLAVIGKSIRQGYTGADFDQCSAGGGQAADPEQTFRDKKDVIHPELARTKAEHEESCAYHRNCAAKAPSMARCAAQHKAADAHRIAAESGDAAASAAARAASKELL